MTFSRAVIVNLGRRALAPEEMTPARDEDSGDGFRIFHVDGKSANSEDNLGYLASSLTSGPEPFDARASSAGLTPSDPQAEIPLD